MIKTTKCLSCGGALHLSVDQAVIRCHYCDSEFLTDNPPPLPPPNLPNPPVVPEIAAESSLRIEFGGAWLVIDQEVKIFLDGQQIGVGSIKKGFDSEVKVSAGKHVLELRTSLMKKSYDFEISAGGSFSSKIEYSRAWGNFSSDLNLKRR